MSEEKAESCLNDTTAKEMVEVFEDIAYFSETQEQLTANLTLVRNAAVRTNKKAMFDKVLTAAKNAINPEDMNNLEWRYKYTLNDFASTDEPYEEVFNQSNAFLRQRTLDRIAIEAMNVGFKGFKGTYKAFENQMRKVNESSNGLINPSNFPSQPLELECGEWHCDSTGVSRVSKERVDYACLHPIMPVERLVNIDTGEEKLRIAFSKGKGWRDFIAPKRELFDSSKIVKFAGNGVAVTSKSAKYLAEYLCDVETLNMELIPETESVSRLGYVGDKKRFAPYVKDLVFDGDAAYSTLYSSITESGDYDKWLAEAIKCRNESTAAHIMLAASFASPLIEKLGCLPFFVHLWSVESGTGKTVALMLAASVWGNPSAGRYIQSFNSTQVGHEKTAAFLNNIPMLIDELQLAKSFNNKTNFSAYQLAQGVGRTRGNKNGGVDKTPTWALCILTTGESPITQESDGAGAINRVLEIECLANDKVIRDGAATSSCLKLNYGFAGRKFIESMNDEIIEKAKERYTSLYKTLSEGETTEKQAMAAAMVIIGDELADKLIFKTGKVLTPEIITLFLKTKESVSTGQRGYDFICDCVAMNAIRFKSPDENNGEVWGKIEDNKVWFNSTKLNKVLAENGFSKASVMSWLSLNGMLEHKKSSYDRHMSIKTSVYGVNGRYYIIKLPDVETVESVESLSDFSSGYTELL